MKVENWIWVGLIPLFPLLLAVFHGLARGIFRWELSKKWVSASLIVTLLSSSIFSFLSLLDLVGEPDGSTLIDRISTWIGVGVGSSALVGGVALRFDPLSGVFALLVSGVAFLIALYSVIHMDSPPKEERSFDRFFGLFIFQVFAMLVLVLADNLLILLVGFAALAATLITPVMRPAWSSWSTAP